MGRFRENGKGGLQDAVLDGVGGVAVEGGGTGGEGVAGGA